MGRTGVQAVHEPARTGDVRHSQADLTRAKELLGYRPITTLAEGVEQTVAWFTGAGSTTGDREG